MLSLTTVDRQNKPSPQVSISHQPGMEVGWDSRELPASPQQPFTAQQLLIFLVLIFELDLLEGLTLDLCSHLFLGIFFSSFGIWYEISRLNVKF